MPSVEGARKKGSKKTLPSDDSTPEQPVELQDDIDKSEDGSGGEELTPVQRKTKWQKFKHAVSRKMSAKRGKKKGTSVMEVRISQEDEDDTDYEKQWSRKIQHGGAKWLDVESGNGSSRGSSPRKNEDLPEDGILVIHDADDDDEDQ